MVGESSSLGLVQTAASYRTFHQSSPKRLDADIVGWRSRPCQWKGVAAICCLFISVPASSHLKDFCNTFAFSRSHPQANGQPTRGTMISGENDKNHPTPPPVPVWAWDHYLYRPQNSTQGFSDSSPVRDDSLVLNRNLLIAQVVAAPYRSDLRATMAQFGEISNRPNRAYARQWGRNYVRYMPASQDISNTQCDGVDHVVVLNVILDAQQPHMTERQNSIRYDALVLLPPDAIITDLDYDLLAMIPESKLLSIVGLQNRPKQAGGVVFWNLRHALTHEVAQRLWKEMVGPTNEGDSRASA